VEISATIDDYAQKQWRTEEGVWGGLEPFPLAYDLRNKRVRMRQNMVFSTTKIRKNFLGRGHRYPSPRLIRLGACRTSYLDPPILKSWVRHCAEVSERVSSVQISELSRVPRVQVLTFQVNTIAT